MESLRNVTTLFVGLFILIVVIAVAILSDMFTQVGIGILALSTALTALGAIATYIQAIEIRKQREDAERPDVAVYFQSVNRLMYCVIQNFGLLPARNVRISFDPSPTSHDGRKLESMSLFSVPLPYLPPNERYSRGLGASPSVLEQNKTPIRITVKYESSSGRSFEETLTVDLSVLADVHEAERTVSYQLGKLDETLNKIVSQLQKSNGLLINEEHDSGGDSAQNTGSNPS